MPIALGKESDENYCFLHFGPFKGDLPHMESFGVYLKSVSQILNTTGTRHNLFFICRKIKYSCVA